MCPACISNIVIAVAVGVTSTGGLTAFIVQRLRSKNTKNIPTKKSIGVQDENKYRGNNLSKNRNTK